ncbi:HAMP domain-containing protein [Oryzomonas japonica]|uniref:histidine kinase n=1 Tax=Oryzomonas japonica TaxID=2603858 RepID=A0A7J4ZQR2_9BACT|nr:ATP-binding protein [Oryzomonas japonica]KAB0664831.1 HAMP domain-containing protein [Oryzomonas japonica]
MRSIRLSLTVSILAFLACMLLFAWLLFSTLAFKTSANDLYSQKGDYGRTLLSAFVAQLPDVVPTFPEGMILPASPPAVFAQKLADDGVFMRLSLLDANGKVIFTAGTESVDIYLPFSGSPLSLERGAVLPGGGAVARVIPVIRNGVTVGRAGIVLSLTAEDERLHRSQKLFMTYFVIDFILLLGFGSYILSRIVVKPINSLLAATEKITGGHYSQQVHVSGSAELVRLAESFNDMSRALLSKERLVSEHVAALEKANEELRQAREEAIHTEKMASIGLLAAGMAHEVGTPLASIMGYAELLSGEQPHNSAVQDYAQRISGDCNRIDRIVRGLLDFARPRGSAVEACDLSPLVTASLELLAQQGAFKRIKVSTQLDEHLPMALVDPHQLQQVLINLILNSRDAMPDGGKLAIRAKQDACPPFLRHSACCLRLDVMDSGGGIPEEHLARIFDPFFTTKPPGKGTGLGLAISARIVEAFGGRITVKSVPGTGSCFTVWLPAQVAEDAP